MKITLLYLILLIYAMSCSNNKNYKIHKIKSFPINKELTKEVVEIDTMPSCPRYLILAGKYLVLLNFKNCDHEHVHVYDKNSFQYIGSFGTYGRGPNELVGPLPSWQVVDNDTISGFWIKNQRNNRFELVNIQKSLKSNQFVIESNFYYTPLSEGRSARSYVVDDDNIIAKSSEGEKGRFYLYNLKTKSISWVGFFPEVATTSIIKKQNISTLYDSEDAISKDGKFFVSAVDIAKRLDIFDNKLNHRLSVVYKDSPDIITFPSKTDDWHNTFAHFDGIYVGNKLIYILNHKISLSGRTTEDNPEVHILSIEGKAKSRYVLDVNKRFQDFTIDEESNSILCLINTDEGYPQIIKYRIP